MFVQNASRKEVVAQHPSAVKIVKVEGGYKVFESLGEYETWRKQK